MNKRTLIREVAKRTGFSMRKSKKLVDCLLNEFTLALKKELKISIKNFGSFSTKIRQGKRYYNISKKQFDYSTEKKCVKFTPYKQLIGDINKKLNLGIFS